VGDVWVALGTAEFARIVWLSLTVSLSATALAAIVGLPCGAALAICRFPGRRLLILLANAFLGLPPVVVGLALYLILSRSGPLGALALLFTPGAMVIAQTALATPIITALTQRVAHRRRDPVTVDPDASGDRSPLRRDGSFGGLRAHDLRSRCGLDRRCHIAGYTRIMTTAIVLKTSEGELGLALGLGLVLIGISIAVSASAFVLWEK